ncbi:hypothetical protein HYV73_03995 [Candidatus Uhrbacteria bacterium]|nr:hypothetical protein [Candidatus Uhrbacteria bacterium]
MDFDQALGFLPPSERRNLQQAFFEDPLLKNQMEQRFLVKQEAYKKQDFALLKRILKKERKDAGKLIDDMKVALVKQDAYL